MPHNNTQKNTSLNNSLESEKLMDNENYRRLLNRIKEKLKGFYNPIIFYDDDPDGITSYLIVQDYLKSLGMFPEGVIVKSSPMVNKDFINKHIEEHHDIIFILDKPLLNEDVFEIKLPIIYFDHHIKETIKDNWLIQVNPRDFDVDNYILLDSYKLFFY